MSCGPLNALLTSSIDCTINGPFLSGDFINTFNKFIDVTLIADNTTDVPLAGLLTSSLQCDNFLLPSSQVPSILIHGYNLEAEVSSTSSLQACIFPG